MHQNVFKRALHHSFSSNNRSIQDELLIPRRNINLSRQARQNIIGAFVADNEASHLELEVVVTDNQCQSQQKYLKTAGYA